VAARRYLLAEVDRSDPSASQPVSLVEAAAYLGVTLSSLRHHLISAGHPPKVREGGRAFLTIPIEEADAILRKRREVAERAQTLPGWSADQVGRALGIRTDTVHRLHQLGKLPAEYRVEGMGNRKWRWKPETVRAYARRVHRTLAEADGLPIAEADAIVRERRRLAGGVGELPGWPAAKVAEVLGIRLATVYRLRELGKLPAAHEMQAIGGRKWRWEPETVRSYARRVGRTLAE